MFFLCHIDLFHQESIVELCRLIKQTSSDYVNVQSVVVFVVIRENTDEDRKCCRDNDRLSVEKKSFRDKLENEWW